METDRNPFPEFQVFNPMERIKKIGRFLFGSDVNPANSDHYRGEEQWREIVTADLSQVNRWTDMGEYMTQDGEF